MAGGPLARAGSERKPNVPAKTFWLVSNAFTAASCLQVVLACALLLVVPRKLRDQRVEGVHAACLATTEVNSPTPCNAMLVASCVTLAAYTALMLSMQPWGGAAAAPARITALNLLYRPYMVLAGGVVWGVLAMYSSAAEWNLDLPARYRGAQPWRSAAGAALWAQLLLWGVARGTDRLLDAMVAAPEGQEGEALAMEVVYVD